MTATLAIVPMNMAFSQSQTVNEKDTSAMSMTRVKLVTNMGDIVLELGMAKKAPTTTENFLTTLTMVFTPMLSSIALFQTLWFRWFWARHEAKILTQSIKNEADNGLKNDKYTIAMART